MKTAICFYGLVGSRNDKNGKGVDLDPNIAWKYYESNILKENKNVDIFIHSWSIDSEEELIRLYKPVNYLFEKQILFPESKNHPEIIRWSKYSLRTLLLKIIKPHKYKMLKIEKEKEAFRAYSRWFSTRQSIKLKKDYEDLMGFTYDCVMITRLDVGFFTKLKFDQLDLNYFYASNWNDAPNEKLNLKANRRNNKEGIGFLDFWFISNSVFMDKFANLYDMIRNYSISPHSSSRQHIGTFTKNVRYILYRWFDHEMIRRKFFDSKK
jgi:hypothetical protein